MRLELLKTHHCALWDSRYTKKSYNHSTTFFMSTWWEIAHKYLPAFWAGKTFTVYILLPRGAKSALTTSIRLSLTSFPKTNESLGEGQSRTTKAFVFTFTEKNGLRLRFYVKEKKGILTCLYFIIWNGKHFCVTWFFAE